MASRAHSVTDDVEAAPDIVVETELNPAEEYQRIKGNYRTTVIVPELPANYPETQVAFQELQNELQDFLGSHIPKVASLQAILHNLAHSASIYENKPPRVSRMTGGSLFIQNTDAGLSPDPHLDPDQTKVNHHHHHDSAMPSRHPSVNAHMQALQAFLTAHMENIVALQSSTPSSTAAADVLNKRQNGRFVPSAVIHHDGARQPEHWWTQRCHAVIIISTATAIFTFALMTFSQLTLGNSNKSRTAFEVGMTFAFLSLFFHFGIILIGGRGARQIAHHTVANEKDSADLDPVYFAFYLTICEQLQMLATLLLTIATFVFSFLVFSSTLGFPFLVLFVTGIGTAVVVSSAYFKVLITVGNVAFLVKNIRRLGWRTLDYLRTNVKPRPTPVY